MSAHTLERRLRRMAEDMKRPLASACGLSKEYLRGSKSESERCAAQCAKPRLLDLFCCEGGAGKGYADAGFEVLGVDLLPQPRYPFEFQQMDALSIDPQWIADNFDAVHASPPCQGYSVSKNAHKTSNHPMLVEPTRALLKAAGVPYIIENVVGAPLEAPILLCGTMFGLSTADDDGEPLILRRHRLFESSLWINAPTHCICADLKARGFRVAGAYGGGSVNKVHAKNVRHGGYTPSKARRVELIGADWMTLHGLSQSIPPAYTEWIGRQILAAIIIGSTLAQGRPLLW